MRDRTSQLPMAMFQTGAVVCFAKIRLMNRRYILGGEGLLKNPPPPAARQMLIVGHRGASAMRPENSRAAFVWAFEHGIRGIELDVHRTADDKIVVNHDLTLRRMCPAEQRRHFADVINTPIHHLTMDQIRKVPSGLFEDELQYPISLQEVLQLVPAGGVVFLEVKRETDTPDHKTFELVAKAIQSYQGSADIRFISFGWDGLAVLKKRCPDRKCYGIKKIYPFLPGGRNSLKRLVDRSVAMGLDGIDVNADSAVICKDISDYAHSRDQELYVWRANLESESCHLWNAMAIAGVDGFTSDIPEDLLRWQAAIPSAES